MATYRHLYDDFLYVYKIEAGGVLKKSERDRLRRKLHDIHFEENMFLDKKGETLYGDRRRLR